MGKMTKIGLAAALLLAGGTAARADIGVQNQTDKSVWITAYDYVGWQSKNACIEAGKGYIFTDKAFYAQGNITYVRAELKEKSGCGGKTLQDTHKGPPISIGANTVKNVQLTAGRLYVK